MWAAQLMDLHCCTQSSSLQLGAWIEGGVSTSSFSLLETRLLCCHLLEVNVFCADVMVCLSTSDHVCPSIFWLQFLWSRMQDDMFVS